MQGKQFREIRRALGMTVREYGRALGYVGNLNTVAVDIRRYERGKRQIPPSVAERAESLADTRIRPRTPQGHRTEDSTP